ncbi:MAG TPA: hypothetical protein PLW61_01280 [Caldisericia bacterium]|nr:hypothetical protein [Caldisericia bacterium]HPB33388.1 hypothetical protein [Caldisericia bacterium]HQL66826.1 hypothetical protein [Caldisericia bacterium]HQN48031.1 hypothetical protein [Caldisericia bacterium]HQO99135.1 hypothetical protein [Caldisericia bacterium]
MNNCLNLLGSIAGIFSFLYIIFLIVIKGYIKPNVEICDYIARRITNNDIFYTIKICNKTRFALVNINAELLLMRNAVDLDDCIKKIPLLYSTISDIPAYGHPNLGHFRKFQIENINIDNLLNDNKCYLLFKLACTHSISKREEIFTKKYTKESIKDGTFNSTSLKIVKSLKN